jgi:hypothetical protein
MAAIEDAIRLGGLEKARCEERPAGAKRAMLTVRLRFPSSHGSSLAAHESNALPSGHYLLLAGNRSERRKQSD